MKKLFVIWLMAINVYAVDSADDNSTNINYIDHPLQALKDTSAYLDSLNTQENIDRAKEIYENSTDKMKKLAAKGLAEVYCSKKYRDEIQCKYWLEKAGIKP